MFDINAFKTFVSGLRLSHFSAEELLTKTDRVHNHQPERSDWESIAPTILILDRMRSEMGVSINLNSVYRSHEYNRRLRGSGKRSQHVAFNAIDFTTGNRALLDDFTDKLISWRGEWFDSPRQYERSDIVIEGRKIPRQELSWRDRRGVHQFKFNGGVSLYSSFVHIDTRGYDAGW